MSSNPQPQYCALGCGRIANGPHQCCAICNRRADLIASGCIEYVKPIKAKPREVRYMRRSRTITVKCKCNVIFSYASKNGGSRRWCDNCREKGAPDAR